MREVEGPKDVLPDKGHDASRRMVLFEAFFIFIPRTRSSQPPEKSAFEVVDSSVHFQPHLPERLSPLYI